MTQFELQILLDALAQQCPVGPSEHIEEAVDIDVNGTLVSVQWSEDARWIELTVALPPLIDPQEQPETLLALYRALLERQWTEWGGDEGLGFGLLPNSHEVVAMTTLDSEAFTGPDAFLALLNQIVASALAEWYSLCTPLLLPAGSPPPATLPHATGPTFNPA